MVADLQAKGDMDNTQVRLHTCDQVNGDGLRIEGLVDQKCRCRKFVSLAEAAQLILDGAALAIITSAYPIEEKKVCRICEGLENLVKSCDNCKKTGFVVETRLDIRRGEDIYMRPVKRTPRTATVEAKHIGYAYNDARRGSRASDRIEESNYLDEMMLVELGAQLRDQLTGEIIIKGTPEPEDNPKTGQGRRFDYGRTI